MSDLETVRSKINLLLDQLHSETPETPETPDIIRDLTENFNPSDILTLLEIAHLSLKWPKDRSGLGDILDLSDQYLETLGLTLSGILSDKLETL